jgi:hypothetical protein
MSLVNYGVLSCVLILSLYLGDLTGGPTIAGFSPIKGGYHEKTSIQSVPTKL